MIGAWRQPKKFLEVIKEGTSFDKVSFNASCIQVDAEYGLPGPAFAALDVLRTGATRD